METTRSIESTGSLSAAKRKLLSAVLNGQRSPTQPNEKSISVRRPSQAIPLSLAQEEIWFRMLEARDKPPFYNESVTFHRHGPLDAAVVERAFMEVIRRHEAWRTTFDLVNGEPKQFVHLPSEHFTITHRDLASLSKETSEAQALRLVTEHAQKPFDLKAGPLVRVMLIDMSPNDHRIHVTMHQIIVDGVSVFRVLPLELSALCDGFSQRKPALLANLDIQYGDFSCWQKEVLNAEVLRRQLTYWREQLSGKLPVPSWPQGVREAISSYKGAILPGTWPRQLMEDLRELCQRESVSLFTVLLAGFVLRCHRDTGKEDVIVGTLAPAGRERHEVQNLLGYFLNPVALRFRISKHLTFRELLRQTREVVSGAIANDDVPFRQVVREVTDKQSSNRTALFDAVISLAPGLPSLPQGWTQTFMDVESGGSTWNFYLELNERPESLMFRAQYNPDCFRPETIRQVIEDMKSSLAIACANPQRLVSELQ